MNEAFNIARKIVFHYVKLNKITNYSIIRIHRSPFDVMNNKADIVGKCRVLQLHFRHLLHLRHSRDDTAARTG